MIKLRDGSAIVIEPKGEGLKIVLNSKTPVANKDVTTNKDAKQEQVFTFTLPMSMVPKFYGSLFGKNNFTNNFTIKNGKQYTLVVMHAGMQKRSQQNKTNKPPDTTNTSMTQSLLDIGRKLGLGRVLPITRVLPVNNASMTQSDTGSEKKQNQIEDLELVNLLVYEKQEGGKRAPKYIAKFTVSRVNILRLKQEVKKAMKQVERWSLRIPSMTLTKAGSVMILTQKANQLTIDHTKKDELKDDLIEFIMSNREEYTISMIKFTKDDAMTLVSLLTHMEI